jgi:hypothetical protein
VFAIAACSAPRPHSPAIRAQPAVARPAAAPVATSAPPAPAQVYPLTGLPASSATTVSRPALSVKVDNAPAARPQEGLDRADVVYEEIVEGGYTRFLAVFQSTDAPVVGPVRSVRPTDPLIAGAIEGLFAYSGGTQQFVAALRAAPVIDVGVDALPAGYKRRGGASPHNVFTSTPTIYAAASSRRARAPEPLFDYADKGASTAGPAYPVSHVQVAVGGVQVAYDWDAGTGAWRRSQSGSPHLVASGTQISPANVIVQFVRYEVVPGAVDPAGKPVDLGEVIGSGSALILSRGTLIKGTWSKAGPRERTIYRSQEGSPVALDRGSTWVELAGLGAQSSWR